MGINSSIFFSSIINLIIHGKKIQILKRITDMEKIEFEKQILAANMHENLVCGVNCTLR